VPNKPLEFLAIMQLVRERFQNHCTMSHLIKLGKFLCCLITFVILVVVEDFHSFELSTPLALVSFVKSMFFKTFLKPKMCILEQCHHE